jgi:hypothetical protein
MRRLVIAAVLVAVLAPCERSSSAGAQGSDADVRVIAVARYAALGYDTGDRFVSEFDPQFSRDVTSEDRRAYEEVRKLLERWRRFVIVSRPGDAEVLIGVRAGRFLTVGVGTQGGAMAPAGAEGQSRQVQVSSPHDMLTVRDRSGSVLWRQQLSGGFSDPEMPLFERLRTAVDAASKRP